MNQQVQSFVVENVWRVFQSQLPIICLHLHYDPARISSFHDLVSALNSQPYSRFFNEKSCADYVQFITRSLNTDAHEVCTAHSRLVFLCCVITHQPFSTHEFRLRQGLVVSRANVGANPYQVGRSVKPGTRPQFGDVDFFRQTQKVRRKVNCLF